MRFLSRSLIALAFSLTLAMPAAASTVAFEDDGVLSGGQWQFNTIISLYPNTQQVSGESVTLLDPESTSYLGQLNQEIRYGLTDQLMLRTTVPVSFLRGGTDYSVAGLGDWEVFLKGHLIGEGDSDFNLSGGVQCMLPTSLPSQFAVNGSVNLIPSLMASQKAGPGLLVASLGYQRPLDYEQDGHQIHPSDVLLCAVGWTVDLNEELNLTLDVLGSSAFDSMIDRVPEPDTGSRQITLGPGFTWALSEHHALIGSLQVPVMRFGSMAASQPLFGLLQFSQTF